MILHPIIAKNVGGESHQCSHQTRIPCLLYDRLLSHVVLSMLIGSYDVIPYQVLRQKHIILTQCETTLSYVIRQIGGLCTLRVLSHGNSRIAIRVADLRFLKNSVLIRARFLQLIHKLMKQVMKQRDPYLSHIDDPFVKNCGKQSVSRLREVLWCRNQMVKTSNLFIF